MPFSFGFSGDDIAADVVENIPKVAASGSSIPRAFPIPGREQLPATYHSLSEFLSQLPSKVAFGVLNFSTTIGDDIKEVILPRRELWDVRVQLMAEDEVVLGDEDRLDNGGFGRHDVKTGIYEGGFKSWESSVDLVKVLAAQNFLISREPRSLRLIELGCGTALPSLAVFTWMMQMDGQSHRSPCSFILCDYNPSVLRLVTLPNIILAWALQNQRLSDIQDAFSIEGELELSPGLIEAFRQFLSTSCIDLIFISGGWSPEFVETMFNMPTFSTMIPESRTILLGAETIYSPFALQAFTQVVFAIMEHEHASCVSVEAYVAAKRLYFGVGGSLNDFIEIARSKGAIITELSEETEGVRRGVVRCVLQR